jgi:hypothetical protein
MRTFRPRVVQDPLDHSNELFVNFAMLDHEVTLVEDVDEKDRHITDQCFHQAFFGSVGRQFLVQRFQTDEVQTQQSRIPTVAHTSQFQFILLKQLLNKALRELKEVQLKERYQVV